MTRKKRELGNDTYFTVFNKDLKLIHDPVKKILFAKIKNWIYRNEDKKSKTHFKDGYYWTFGTYAYWAEECGLESKTVGDHLRELVASGILKTGNYNRLGIDKTIWYRLATDEEMKNVNFRVLFYGKAKCNNPGNDSNETIYAMYQNGMIDMKKTDIDKEQFGSPLPEDKSDYNTELITEDSSDHKTHIISDNKINIEKYKLINSDNIHDYVEFLSVYDANDISTDIIKLFANKFHDMPLDSIINDDQWNYFQLRIDGLFENILNQTQLDFIKQLTQKYYNIIILPQHAEQNRNKNIPMNAILPQIPMSNQSSSNQLY